MEKVTGFGGFFFRAKDPKGLATWYRDFLGVGTAPEDADQAPWRQEAGDTVFAPFAEDTDYFGSKDRAFMLNFRVRDLDTMTAQLRAAGIEVQTDPDSPHDYGSFAWLHDPEGNKLELWEPAAD